MKRPLVSIVLFLSISDLCNLLHVNSQTDSCDSNFDLNSQFNFDTSSLICNSVWSAQDYLLRYKQEGPSLWTFVLSAPNASAYVAIAFSPDGNMVGSSAVVGWVSGDGSAGIKQYFLGGKSPAQVVVNQGNLKLAGNSSAIITVSSRLYMGFQLETEKPEARVLYAVGPVGVFPTATSSRLGEHNNKISTTVNYATGQIQTQKNRPYSNIRKTHGAINLLGWGILMPIGVIVARFAKQWDPLWFYAHVSIQSLGFIFGVSGVICGFVLEDKTSAEVDRHKSLGVVILALGCLQVIAFLARPRKDSKYRKYWNWYHYLVGRVLILLAVINIFHGIHLGKAGSSWNIGYAVAIAVLFVVALLLEIKFLIMRKNRL